MFKRACLFACVGLACSGQSCRVNVNPVTGVPLRNTNAFILITRDAGDSTAVVEAEVTRGFAGVRLEETQKIVVNDVRLQGVSRYYDAIVPADDGYLIAVTDPRRGTDQTVIDEPGAFEITSPGEGGDASLSGFTIEWTNVDPKLDVRVLIRQRLFGEDLFLAVGPFVDTGSLSLGSRQIADAGFGQGRDMTILVTKIRREDHVLGFADGRAECHLTESINVKPRP